MEPYCKLLPNNNKNCMYYKIKTFSSGHVVVQNKIKDSMTLKHTFERSAALVILVEGLIISAELSFRENIVSVFESRSASFND